jgi:D-alanyl-D-alanine-carboxypeptidase/D-alanyl-D-alanine-endopeptidase
MRAFQSLLLIAAVPAVPLVAQSATTDSAVHAILKERVDAGLFAGIAVGLVSLDGTRRIITYGPAAGVQPFDGDAVFEIGSITKTFTAAILADMVAKGELSLDDPVADHLPEGTVVPERDGEKITLGQLATQTSGLPRMPSNIAPADVANPYADYTPELMYAFLRDHELTRGVGEKYEYSNLGFGLLGQALAHHAGVDYETLVHERILDPLGMDDTRILLSPAMLGRLAPGHAQNGTDARNWDIPTLAGAGALRSTVNDMLTYIRANADSTSRPLGAVMALTHGERRNIGSPESAIGLGWHRLKVAGGRTFVWHNGGTGGYRSFTGYDELTGEGVVVLANTNRSVDNLGFHLLNPSTPLVPVPEPREEISLPPEDLDRVVGTYEFRPDFSIAITREGTRIFAQATGQGRFEIFPEAQWQFFAKVAEIELWFRLDVNGVVSRMVLRQGGVNAVAQKRMP